MLGRTPPLSTAISSFPVLLIHCQTQAMTFLRSRAAIRETTMKHLLTDIPGIGEKTAALMAEHGIDSLKALRKGGAKKLDRVPGFGEKRAIAVLAAADRLKAADKTAEKEAKKATRVAEKKAEKVGKAAKKAAKAIKREAKKAAKAIANVCRIKSVSGPRKIR